MSFYDRLVREACRRLSPFTERLGFVLSPVHFYYPVPATRDLTRRDVWAHKTAMAGIDWDLDKQLEFLQQLQTNGRECNWPEQRDETRGIYGWNAMTFGFTSAMLAHAMVRHFKPAKMIEVGCGWSTTILLGASKLNESEGRAPVDYLGIEPYPPAYLEQVAGVQRIKKSPVQDVPLETLTDLSPGDILFIDSSHGLSIGSDVQYLFLEVLPRLATGVVVHIHDIQLPYEYPRHHALKQRWFWNEQYLLQALLAGSSRWEILAGGYALCHDRPQQLRQIFPAYDPAVHGETGSFWMIRK